jgi:hypothetical protein
VREALERLLLDGELVYEPIGGHDLIYLPYLRRAEDGIAGLLRKLASAPSCKTQGVYDDWKSARSRLSSGAVLQPTIGSVCSMSWRRFGLFSSASTHWELFHEHCICRSTPHECIG